MKFAFNINSPLWKFFDLVGDMIVVNVLFIITSIPVFTIGTAITAMNAVYFRRMEKRLEDRIYKEYFRAFKENFKQSVGIWLLFLAFFALCVMNVNAMYHVNPDGRALTLVVLGVLLAIVGMTVMYSLAMTARFENSFKDTIVKAFVIGVMNLPKTIMMVVIMAAAVILTVQTYLSMFIMAGIWLVVGFGALGYLFSILFMRAFRRFTAKEDLPEESDFMIEEQQRRKRKKEKQD